MGYSGTGTFTQSGGTNNRRLSAALVPRLQLGFQRQLQPQRLGSCSPQTTSTWATPAPARSPSPAGRTTLAMASFTSATTGFQRQLQPQRLGMLSADYASTWATPAAARLPSPAGRTSLGGYLYLGYNRVPAAATTSADGMLSAFLNTWALRHGQRLPSPAGRTILRHAVLGFTSATTRFQRQLQP